MKLTAEEFAVLQMVIGAPEGHLRNWDENPEAFGKMERLGLIRRGLVHNHTGSVARVLVIPTPRGRAFLQGHNRLESLDIVKP